MLKLIRDKAEAIGNQEFSKHWDQLKADVNPESSESDRQAAKVKNISLRLLNVTSPTQVLDLFEEEFINVARDGREKGAALASVEELFMLLYFFKTQIREFTDAQGTNLIK